MLKRIDNRLPQIGGILIVSVFCSFFILIYMYPLKPDSLLGWITLYLASLPITYIFEVGGEKLLDNKFTDRIGSLGRILYAIVLFGLLFVLLAMFMPNLDPYLTKW